jgi:hypothetical protein
MSSPDAPPPELFRTRPGNRRRYTVDAQAEVDRLAAAGQASAWLSPLAYNLTISHSHRFVWYRVAKVATRTIRHHCETHGVTMDVDHAMRVRYPLASFVDYFTFAFVRDPLDRFISAWQDKVHQQNHFRFPPEKWERMKKIEHFAQWVAKQDLRDLGPTDRHIALQSRLIDLGQVDYLGRMESFGADFSAVCEAVGLHWREPVRQNRSRPQGINRDNVSDEVRSIVREKYRLDYQVFGY